MGHTEPYGDRKEEGEREETVVEVSGERNGVEGGVMEGKPFPGSKRPVDPVALSWSGLTFEVEEGGGTKQILKNIAGELVPGEVTAIMGPSGAGKSTLLNVLAGRAPYGRVGGSVSLNKDPVDPVQYRRRIAYVMQEDALYATQTPRELLHFTAGLRLPELSGSEREELVNGTIVALGLEACADTMVGSVMMPGLSGGEKKRTAIAVELISSPSIIFLDEPTSGLDAFSAYQVVSILRDLAGRGCTIVCTIHQPSSEVFEMFDKVMLLRRGYVVYNGRVGHMVEHFAEHGHHCKPNYNPADFAMFKLKQMSDDEVAPLIQHVTPRRTGSDLSGVGSSAAWSARRAGVLLQYAYLCRREMLQVVRDKPTLGARFGMSVVLALLVGLAFLGAGSEWDSEREVLNHYGALVFFAINQMFLNAQPLLLAFPMERPVFLREYTSGTYSAWAYFLAKTTVDVPTSFLQCAISTLVVYWMVEFNGNVMLIILSLTFLGIVSTSTALVIGTATKEAATAINLAPAVYVPQILFSGMFISLDSMPVFMRWAQYLCSLKYSVNLFTLVEFHDGIVPDHLESQVHEKILDANDIDMDDVWIYCIIMAGIFLAFRILAGIILSVRARNFS